MDSINVLLLRIFYLKINLLITLYTQYIKMSSVTVYNTTAFTATPAASTFQFAVTDLTTTDPSGGSYDYTLAVEADLNSVLADFTYFRDLANNVHTVTNEAAAWADLQALLDTGTSGNSVTADSFLTTFSDGDTGSNASWGLFWAGLISECIDPQDKDGLSVKTSELNARIDYPTNLGSYANVGAAQAASFGNDITGTINDALGATTTTNSGGVIQSNSSNAFGSKAINTPPSANTNYFVALAHFLYELRGATAAGSEGSLSGDPSDGAKTLKLLDGDAIALRISCSVTGTKTGLITITQASGGGGA